jgi:hypothetical protein
VKNDWAVILVLAFCCLAASSQQGAPAQPTTPSGQKEQKWKEYEFPDDAFAITLPSAPKPHKDPQDKNFNVYTISLVEKDSLLSLRAANRFVNCEAGLREVKRGLQNGADQERLPLPGSLQEISFGGSPALDYEYLFNASQKVFERYYCADQKLYIFTFLYPTSQERPPSSTRILQSFHLIRADSNRHPHPQIPITRRRSR